MPVLVYVLEGDGAASHDDYSRASTRYHRV
jgi:hypothetical protein